MANAPGPGLESNGALGSEPEGFIKEPEWEPGRAGKEPGQELGEMSRLCDLKAKMAACSLVNRKDPGLVLLERCMSGPAVTTIIATGGMGERILGHLVPPLTNPRMLVCHSSALGESNAGGEFLAASLAHH